MARLKPLFRIAAVLNAVLLLCAYVAYRGGVVQAFGSTPAAPSEPTAPSPENITRTLPPAESAVPESAITATALPAASPATDASRTVVNDYSMVAKVYVVPTESPASALRRHEVLLSGSKSSPIEFSEKRPSEPMEVVTPWPTKPPVFTRREASPPPKAAAPAVRQEYSRRMIMSSSKSMKVEIVGSVAPAPSSTPPAVKPSDKHSVLMKSSKSGPIEFDVQVGK